MTKQSGDKTSTIKGEDWAGEMGTKWLANLARFEGMIADSELMPPTIPRNSRPGFRTDPAHHSD